VTNCASSSSSIVLQNQFNNLFDQVLERQLRLKAMCSRNASGKSIKDNVRYVWQQDSHFEELKGQEIWTSRLNLLDTDGPIYQSLLLGEVDST
jgi:hypothetical protein